jgi:hypothetical protein
VCGAIFLVSGSLNASEWLISLDFSFREVASEAFLVPYVIYLVPVLIYFCKRRFL